MTMALEGIQVLDLTHALSGPYGTMILADLGAEVIKVEPRVHGDKSRGTGPLVNGVSTYFFSINRGKKSITVDLKTAQGKAIIYSLVKGVDIVTENFLPGTMDRLGLGYERLREINPRLIYASVSGFGQTGPYATKPALDIIVQAMGGLMSITGEPEGPPLRTGVSIGDIAAGMYMAIGILAALHERNRSNQGQMIDISMLDCQLALLENAFIRHLNTGEIPGPIGSRHPVVTPFGAFRTKDSWLVLAMSGAPGRWELLCATIGRTDLMDDERFQTNISRNQHVQELEVIFTRALREKTTAQWLEELEAIGVPCAPIKSIDQVAVDPQVVSRRMITEVAVNDTTGMRLIDTPIKMSRTPAGVGMRAPNAGEHTRAILTERLGFDEEQLDELGEKGVI